MPRHRWIYHDETHTNLCDITNGIIAKYQSVRQQWLGS